jgi:hypothetical protein
MNMTLFQEWYDMSVDGTFSMDLMAERAAIRFEQTKASNPEFYYGPVTGFLARNAGYLFPARLFRNHSSEVPEGVLSEFSFVVLSGFTSKVNGVGADM